MQLDTRGYESSSTLFSNPGISPDSMIVGEIIEENCLHFKYPNCKQNIYKEKIGKNKFKYRVGKGRSNATPTNMSVYDLAYKSNVAEKVQGDFFSKNHVYKKRGECRSCIHTVFQEIKNQRK